MSLEQIKTFLDKDTDDANLQEQLKAKKSPQDVVDIAKEHGHEFKSEHLSQLSEEELEDVAGGGTRGYCAGGGEMYSVCSTAETL